MKGNTNCCVPLCHSKASKDPHLSFHRFPREGETTVVRNSHNVKVTIERRKEWILRFRIGKSISKRMLVCSKHFRKEDFMPGPVKGKIRERPRLKQTALPSLYLPIPVADKNEKTEGRNKVVQKMQEKYKKIRWMTLNNNVRNFGCHINNGADALLMLSQNNSLAGLPSEKSILKKNEGANLGVAIPTESIENLPMNIAANRTEKPNKVFNKIASSVQELSDDYCEKKSDISSTIAATGSVDSIETDTCNKEQRNVLSIFCDEANSELSMDSEDTLFSENELSDSEVVSKEKYLKLTACYKKSQRKLKEYQRLCKLYMKEVNALKEVINNLKQINSIADDNYFGAKF